MINKTFNSDSTDGRALEVGRNGERTWLNIREFDLENTMFMLAPSDVPALALAILEAAGVEAFGAGYLNKAVDCLQLHAREQERATAEATERAELEAEALALFNARQEAIHSVDWEPYEDFATEESKQTWLAVARRAREIGGRAEK